MNIIKALLLSLSLMMSLNAFATNETDHEGEYCERHKAGFLGLLDTNKDGSVDRSEMKSMQDKKFEEMDTNHDGKLSEEELLACQHSKK